MLKELIFMAALVPGVAMGQLLSSFAPDNNEERPVSASLVESSNGMTEALFNEILDRVEEVYEPLVAAKGARLEIQRDWSASTVNAYAQQIGNRWIIKMFGGLARHETVTPDAFALVACHEMGHHLGGAPLYRSISWASNEGQSDYYTTLKCSRKIWGNEDNVALMEQKVAAGEIENYALDACNAKHADEQARALCLRGSMGGLSLATLLAALGRTGDVDFQTPDTSVVNRTQDRHPAAQCRLDTYFQAALCTVDTNIDPIKSDEAQGMCTRSSGFEVGSRPLCWYKPAQGLSILARI